MDDNPDMNNKDKIALLVCSFFFMFIYFIYLIPILIYLINNRKRKLCVYWIDYSSLVLSGIIFIITFIVKLISEPDRENIKFEKISKNTYYIIVTLFLILMCLFLIKALFFDSIIACKLSYRMNKIKKIDDVDYISLKEKLKNIHIVNILTNKSTKILYAVFALFELTFFLFALLINVQIISYDLQTIIKDSLRIYHLLVLILLLSSIVIMNSVKKSLLEKNYYSRNRIAQEIYNVYFNQIIYFTDIISFKLVSDLVMNVPALIFLSHFKFNTLSLILSEFAILIYIFLGGSEYLIIDKYSNKHRKAEKIDKILECLFFMKYLDFHFGEKDHSYVIDQFKNLYTKEEKKIFKDLNLTIVDNIQNNLADFDEKEDLDKSDDELKLNESSENIFANKAIKLEFKTIQEFYLIQKLMMLYFKENKKIYESNTDNNNDDSNFSFSFKKKKKNKIMNAQDKNNYLSNIEELSRKSILDSKKIKSFLKISNYNMFYSIKEKELYEELKNVFNIRNEKHEFIIENIFASKFFELFPFYRMNINSILNSLEPSKNIKIFNKFANRNKKTKRKI